MVRDRSGALLAVADVRHVYTFAGDLVQRMDVEQGGAGQVGTGR